MTRIEDLNLKVVTEHIDELAGHHETAADKIVGANRFAQGVAGRVETTHGFSTPQQCHPPSAAVYLCLLNEYDEKPLA